MSTVRVLGVRSEPASVAPGRTSQLEILCADGRPNAAGRPACDVEIAWFSGCTNPRDADPYGCIPGYGAITSNLSSPISATPVDPRFDGHFGFSSSFTFHAPPDVLAQSTVVNGIPVRYGISYVFFGVCAGSLYPLPPSERRVPLECHDPASGKVLGQDRFVVGYTTIYSYDTVVNDNPGIVAARFDGRALDINACESDADCGESLACRNAVCRPRVSACRTDDCREYSFEPLLTAESFSIRSSVAAGVSIPIKNLWVRYYTTGGHLSDLGAILDPDHDAGNTAAADAGDSKATHWTPPANPDADARIWAIVRDDRGGLAWLEQPVVVQ